MGFVVTRPSRYKAFSVSGAALCLLIAMLLVLPAQSSAASKQNILGVSPAVQSLKVRQGQTRASFTITVRNTGSQPQTITISEADFTTLSSNGSVQFLNPTKDTSDHGLSQAIELAAPVVLVQPGQSRAVEITLKNLDQLKSGGHYGAILFKTAVTSAGSSNNLQLSQSVASLVFLTTEGEGRYGLAMRPLKPSLSFFKPPSTYNFLFTNTGNVQVTPRGYTVVTGPFSHLLTKSILNPDSALVLPGTDRLLQTEVKYPRNAFLPGVYTITTYYKFDGAKDYSKQVNKVIFVDAPLLLGILFVSATSFVFIRRRLR